MFSFGSNEARRAAADAAFAAKSAAAQAFIHMDSTQSNIESQLESFARLDSGETSQRMLTEMAPFIEAASVASTAYLEVVESHPIDDPKAGADTMRAATQAFKRVTQQLVQADEALVSFGEWCAPQIERLDAAIAELASTRSAARDALDRARLAVAGLTVAGLHSASVDRKLAYAERRWRETAAGPAEHGVAEAIRIAQKALEAAGATHSAASAYIAMVDKGRTGLRSVSTRADAVAGRVEPALQILSDLRRKYSRNCSKDLDYVSEDVHGALDQAKSALITAERSGKSGDWEDVDVALRNARRHLDRADKQLRGVTDRARLLDDLAADPKRPAEKSRLVLKDAQRFVLSVPGGPYPNQIRVLDALAARWEAAPELLNRVHPEYLDYLAELDAVADESQAVVTRIRDSLKTR